MALDPTLNRKVAVKLLQATGLSAGIVVVTHELASIYTIGNNSVFLDAEKKTMTATGDPRQLRDEATDPKLHRFLTRGET